MSRFKSEGGDQAPVTQWTEWVTFNHTVAGSNPVGGTLHGGELGTETTGRYTPNARTSMRNHARLAQSGSAGSLQEQGRRFDPYIVHCGRS